MDDDDITLTGCRSRENGAETGDGRGLWINGDNCVVDGCRAFDDQPSGDKIQDVGLRIDGNNCLVSGGQYTDSLDTDIQIANSATETVLDGVSFGTIGDQGTRSIINGNATNAGDPNTTGEWYGNGALAYDHPLMLSSEVC